MYHALASTAFHAVLADGKGFEGLPEFRLV